MIDDQDPSLSVKPSTVSSLQQAAVLIAITRTAQPELLMIQRAASLRYQPGHLAFPGGKAEPTDRDLTHTALRESEEEIGLVAHSVDIIQQLPTQQTPSGFRITPLVGLIHADCLHSLRRDPQEVDSILAVPIEFLATHFSTHSNLAAYSAFTLQGRILHKRDGLVENWQCWGATAAMLRSFFADNHHLAALSYSGTPL